jgi:hypothetical protein
MSFPKRQQWKEKQNRLMSETDVEVEERLNRQYDEALREFNNKNKQDKRKKRRDNFNEEKSFRELMERIRMQEEEQMIADQNEEKALRELMERIRMQEEEQQMIADAQNAANQARTLQLAKDKQRELDEENQCAVQKHGGNVFNWSSRKKFIK